MSVSQLLEGTLHPGTGSGAVGRCTGSEPLGPCDQLGPWPVSHARARGLQSVAASLDSTCRAEYQVLRDTLSCPQSRSSDEHVSLTHTEYREHTAESKIVFSVDFPQTRIAKRTQWPALLCATEILPPPLLPLLLPIPLPSASLLLLPFSPHPLPPPPAPSPCPSPLGIPALLEGCEVVAHAGPGTGAPRFQTSAPW